MFFLLATRQVYQGEAAPAPRRQESPRFAKDPGLHEGRFLLDWQTGAIRV